VEVAIEAAIAAAKEDRCVVDTVTEAQVEAMEVLAQAGYSRTTTNR
jgi:hypothetical protein